MENDTISSKRQKMMLENTPTTLLTSITPERSLQLNCQDRLEVIKCSIEYALNIMGRDASFLDISDFSLWQVLC